MPDIVFDFPVRARPPLVFEAVGTADGLTAWWTLGASGEAEAGRTMHWGFGPAYDWQARVVRCAPGEAIEWIVTHAAEDWVGTRVRFRLKAREDATLVHFEHTGCAEDSAHFRTPAFCWAMYLRLLRRFVERGDVIPYAERRFA